MAEIAEDSRQHAGKHKLKHEWFDAHDVHLVRRKLDFGDYEREGSNISVDTKASVDEIAQNVGGKSHARFRRECERARDAGYSLVILVENTQGIERLEDLHAWMNSHCRNCGNRARKACSPWVYGKCLRHGTFKPIQGPRLAKAMRTMEMRYGVKFMFCKPRDAARIICELLGVRYEQDADGGTQAAFDGVQDAPDKTGD